MTFGRGFDSLRLHHVVGALNEARTESRGLERLLQSKISTVALLLECNRVMGFEFCWKHVASKEQKEQILDAIDRAMATASRHECLSALGFSLSRYKRWRRERRKCGLTGVKSCPKGSANQLTFREVETMKNLVTSPDFSHFPIRSLHYYAKRENLLVCSYSSWRKYIDHFDWKRPRKQFRKRKKRIGIRATRPNEIWHLDVSYFILPDRTKRYIQAIIDNYSRLVVAWQVLDSYDGSKTGELLQKAIRSASAYPQGRGKLRLIVDGGSENKSQSVTRLEDKGHFRKQVARFEISYSNSMVETLFRSLKHNYLFHQEIRSLAALRKHTDFWFNEHNEKIPHTAFNGETPLERYQRTWTKNSEIRILVRSQEAVKMRISENQRIYCERCDVA